MPPNVRTRAIVLRFSLILMPLPAAFPEHTVVTMPALSPTMTAGNIGTWQKQAGDTIVPGDVLVEIETDKAQMDFEFQEDGVLAKILKESGEKDVTVGNVGLSASFVSLHCNANACVADRSDGRRRHRYLCLRFIHD